MMPRRTTTTFVLLTILVILIGILSPTSAQSKTFAYCLRYRDGHDDPGYWILDLNDNSYQRVGQINTPEHSAQDQITFESPNERFSAYIQEDTTVSERYHHIRQYKFYMKTAQGSRLLEPVILFYDEMPWEYLYLSVAWSADSQQMAYTWLTTDFKTYLRLSIAIVKADGTGKRSTEVYDVPWDSHFFDPSIWELRVPDLYGWSLDGQYILTQRASEGNDITDGYRRLFQFWNTKTLKPSGVTTRVRNLRGMGDVKDVYETAWSLHGHQFTLLEYDGTQGWVSIISPEQGIAAALQLPTSAIVTGYDRLEAPRLEWSPAGSILAVRYFSQGERQLQRLVLMAANGQRIWYVSQVANRGEWQGWSADGNYYQFVEGNYGDYQLVRFNVKTAQTEVLQRELVYGPVEIGTQRWLVGWQTKMVRRYGLIDTNANFTATLFEGEVQIDSYGLSPDKQMFFLGVYTGVDANRHEWLVWSRVNGSRRQVFDPGFEVLAADWAEQGHILVYEGKGPQGWEVGIVDSVSAVRQVLLTGLSQVQKLYARYGSTVQGHAFTWQKADHSPGILVYRNNQTRNYNFNNVSDIASVVYAPISDTIALINQQDTYMLQLAHADDQARAPIREHLKFISVPLWSPDGQLLVFAQIDQADHASFDIVDSTGTLIRHYDNLVPLPSTGLSEWVHCQGN